MRALWWWPQDHRRAVAAVIAVAFVCAAVYLLVLPDGESGGGQLLDSRDSQQAFEAAESGRFGQGIGGERDISVERTAAPREAMADAADRPNRRISATPSDRAVAATPCGAGILRGSIVAVSTRGVSCEAAQPIVEAHRSGPVGRAQVDDFVCSEAESGLEITCARARDAATVTLLFGPGGAGLADCEVVPVGESAAIVRVRAVGVGCDDARVTAFRYFAKAGKAPGGYNCERERAAGAPTVSCTRAGTVVAFSEPAG